MAIRIRPYAGNPDLPRIADLIGSTPLSTPHRFDFPWRLSSPALQDGRNVRLWEDSDGNLLGFAAWQMYWAVLDFYVRSGPDESEVEEEIFTWAGERFREIDRERGHSLPYWVEVQSDDTARLAVAARQGFTLDDDFDYVFLARSLADEIPRPTLPEGFAIRSLAGLAEVEAYSALHRAAFNSTSMTPEWRARTIESPQYRSDLDLVVVAPSGEVAGFCVCWLNPVEHVGQIEPIGVHPLFHRQGIARALLLECFGRLKTFGATTAMVETETIRSTARDAYEAVGFHVAHTILRKGRWMAS